RYGTDPNGWTGIIERRVELRAYNPMSLWQREPEGAALATAEWLKANPHRVQLVDATGAAVPGLEVTGGELTPGSASWNLRAPEGTLLVAVSPLPGLVAELNGTLIPIEEGDGVYRRIDLPRGEHELEIRFDP